MTAKFRQIDYNKIIDAYYPEDNALRRILITHSRLVAEHAVGVCRAHPELDADADFVYAAAMLHDIGICRCDAPGIECFGTEPYIRHGVLGGEMVREYASRNGIDSASAERYARVCERHTGTGLPNYIPETTEEQIVCYADKFYSKTHPEVRKSIEKVEKSLMKFGEEGVMKLREWHKRFSFIFENDDLSK